MGYVSVGGNLVVLGRSKDVLNIGDNKIHPSYIQNVLKTHPSVLDAVVVSVPDEEYYQVPCACVVTKPGTTATSGDLKVHFQNHFEKTPGTYGAIKFGCPKYWIFMDGFPRTPVGKVDQRMLLQRVKEELKIL